MPQIPWLDEHGIEFPPLDSALEDPNGLIAAGGDLSAARLVEAYRRGIFPWFDEGQPILWWSPNPRTVLFPERIHISRSMRKLLKKQTFEVTADQAFTEVIDYCAQLREDTSGTWITPEMMDAYCELHRQGVAHSIEVWQQGELVGGLYGIGLGRLFFGESMFSLASNASKIAFIHLAKQCQSWQFGLIDCQMASDHLFSLGAEDIERKVFSQYLTDFITQPAPSTPWQLNTLNDPNNPGFNNTNT